jgi:hypothetical protein
MNLEITGKLLVKYDTMQVSDKFKKREFVVELSEEINGNTYNNYAKMQLVQNKCDIIDRYNVGDPIKVSFSIRGTKWVKDGKENYIKNLDAWRVESAANGSPAPGNNQQQAPAYNNGGGQTQSFNGAPASSNYNTSGYQSSGSEPVDDLPF